MGLGEEEVLREVSRLDTLGRIILEWVAVVMEFRDFVGRWVFEDSKSLKGKNKILNQFFGDLLFVIKVFI